MRLLLFVLVGCSTQQPPPIANHQRFTALECTAEVEAHLMKILRDRWAVPAVRLRCTAGRFRTVGYFLEATSNGVRRTGIVDPSGAVLVPFVDEPRDDPSTFIASYRAADLDADGEDEIIESWRRRPSHATPDNWLVIRTVSGKRLLRIKGPYLSRSHPELGSCSGTWRLGRGTIDIIIRVGAGIPPSDCLPAGEHRFELRGRVLVDARR